MKSEATFHFPKDFLWGTATASYQVEGGNKNCNWSAWEAEGHVVDGHTAAVACDWWGGRWREDFDRAAETNQNTHRMSIEWSRIQPASERWDEAALDQYRQMLRGLRERGLEPMVTLHHFTDPLWLYERGGWEKDISELFATYVEKVVDALKEYVTKWVTINEPNVYATMGYVMGEFPPGKTSLPTALRVMGNLARGHAAAYHAIHRLQPEAQVGIANGYRGIAPYRAWNPLDRMVARMQFSLFNEFFQGGAATGRLRYPMFSQRVRGLRGTQDFIGINYYTQDYAAFRLTAYKDAFAARFYDPEAELSHTKFIANIPEGFYAALKWANQFGLPIHVTENGVEDPNDTLRPRYLIQHIHQMWRAINYGFPIKSYYHWSLVDNFEWERGWTQRFGLWELDLETFARRIRPSADMYAEICETSAISSDLVAKYAPSIYDKMFP